MMQQTHSITRNHRRNVVLERLAYALPYLLFAAAMLLLDSIGRAATQEEFFKSVQDSVNNTAPGSGITMRGFMMFLGAVGLGIALSVLNQRLKRRATAPRRPAAAAAKPATVNQPRKLMKEVARSAELPADEMRQLKALADQHGYDSPLTLLLCPSLLLDGARRDDTKADRQVLARVARKLIEG